MTAARTSNLDTSTSSSKPRCDSPLQPSTSSNTNETDMVASTSAAAYAASTGKKEMSPNTTSIGLLDISLSQIDSAVLAELPSYIQAEIRSQYDRRQRDDAPVISVDAAPPLQTAAPSNSPTKAGVKKGGGGPRRRGRPKKIVKDVTKPPTDPDDVAPVNRAQIRQKDEGELNSLSEESSRSSLDSRTGERGGGGRRFVRPTFCGKSSVEEIRPLLKVKKN